MNNLPEFGHIEIVSGKTFRFVEADGTIRCILFPDAKDPGEEFAAYGFGWSDMLRAHVRLGGPVGREVAKSLARSWLAWENCPEGEMPDPSADIIESDAESDAINIALDERDKLFMVDGGMTASLKEMVAANAHDADVIEFIAKHVNTMSVGASVVYNAGAGGLIKFERLE